MPYMYTFGQKIVILMTFIFSIFQLPAYSASPLFASFTLDRTTIYEGEAFQITLSIHITGETLAPQISIDALPAPNQLQLYPFQELPQETLTLDGLPYEVRKFRAWARAPKAGTVSLSPRLNGTFVQTSRSFFMMQESRPPASIPVTPLPISIKALPEAGRPPDFSGLVGRFAFSVIPTPLNIALGDLITVTFTIQGDLLPDNYLKPAIKPEPDLKVYELKSIASESTPARQVFSQTIVPIHNSRSAIPACSLSFFDTRQMRYKTLTSGPFPLRYHAERTPSQSIYSATQTSAGITNQPPLPAPSKNTSVWVRIWQKMKYEKSITLRGESEVPVRFAPSESAQTLFTLKPGISVTAGATHENWIFISAPDGMGWIHSPDPHP